jgi:2-dehydropantoate 2-reductase
MSHDWHILGAGAIGGLWAAALMATGKPVRLLLKNQRHQSQWQHRQVLEIEELDGNRHSYSPAVSLCQDSAPIHKLLITTKAYDALPALQSVYHRLQSRAIVVLMVNGMGAREQVLAARPALDLYCASTTEGAFRHAPFSIQHAGAGTTAVGNHGRDQPPEWLADWQQSSLHTRWTTDINAALWQKLAVNCAINPLTATEQCLNGELLQPQYAQQLQSLCTEISSVLMAEGQPEIAAQLTQTVKKVISATAANRSSMLQDALAGRRTEIDFITAYLLERAAHHDLDMPANRKLLASIRQLESQP